MSSGISFQRIVDTPVAVIDFETTGLTPGYDRVVEVSVVRIEPGTEPRLVFDSLINPCRPMAGTEIHGITDADVRKAPRFQDITGDLVKAINGCAVAAYNVYFDIKFLRFELTNAGVSNEAPHCCLMYLRPMLGLGSRCKLSEACDSHGIEYPSSHVAAADAMSAGRLFKVYLDEIIRQRVMTFADLARLKSYKFCNSFDSMPFPEPKTLGLKCVEQSLSRAGFEIPVDPVRQALAAYWDALKTVLADLEVTDEEIAYVREERIRGGLKVEQLRVLHARAFTSVLSQFMSDQWLDDREVIKLRRLHHCLSSLGWAPGQ